MNPSHKKPLAIEAAVVIVILLALVAWGYFWNFGNSGEHNSVAVSVQTPRPSPRAAVPTAVSNINVTRCLPAPHEAIVPAAATIGFVNIDKTAHTLTFTTGQKYVISASSKKLIKLDFLKAGKTGYSCDQNKSAGIINVSNK